MIKISLRQLKEYRTALVLRRGYLERRIASSSFNIQMRRELAATKYAIDRISEDIISIENSYK